MEISNIEVMGMPVERITHKNVTADFGVGEDWSTLYFIKSEEEGKGHATELLILARNHYEKLGKRFAGSVALNDRMRAIYKRLNIKEYND